jgi:hypothetical protein
VILDATTVTVWPASSDDALSDGAEDEHGEVDQAADDDDHAEQDGDERSRAPDRGVAVQNIAMPR